MQDKESSLGLKVLVADDDPYVRRVVSDSLREAGFRVLVARDGKEAISRLSEEVLVALLDLKMPEMGGIECLQYIRKKQPGTECIVVTGSGEVRDAVEAMKSGAFEYLTKPVNVDELIALVQRAGDSARLREENRQLKQVLGLPRLQTTFIGESSAAREVRRLTQKVAPLDATVLLTGESGVGKGLVARMIHESGSRGEAALVTVSCTALPRELVEAELFGHEKGAFTGATERRPGKLEMANGGTLFLDEVGDMPLDLQPKLLTFLQDRCFQRIGGSKDITADIRVIAATNQALKSMSEEKRFRQDLYFRLNVLPIWIPPLRQRKQDVLLLADYLLKGISKRRGNEDFRLSDEASQALLRYDWPGNVRELENVLERTTAFSDESLIGVQDLPAELQEGSTTTSLSGDVSLAGRSLQEIEMSAIVQTLELTGDNKGEAARRLGISRKSIYNKMKRFGLE